jgi:diguanylate cyclase (GGDEF)-like protein
VQVAERLTANLRESDTVARIGGDEFVLLVTHLSDCRQAENVAAKILSDIDLPFNLDIGAVNVGASIGIACYPDDGKNNDELLKVADDLMYEVKNDGKNNYRFYSESEA